MNDSGGATRQSPLFRALFPVVLLALATVLAYLNAWPNAAVYDDYSFLVENRVPALTDTRSMFTGDVWRTKDADSQLYRPALLYSLALDRALYGEWLAGYHLSNIALHLLVVLLLYGLLRHLLGRFPDRTDRPDLYALLAALVFAVHPVHTEVVDLVFNRSSMLVSIGATGGIWWLLHHLDRRPVFAWTGLAIAYMLALLSKESAAVIPGLAVLLILLMTPQESWLRRIRRSLPVILLLLPLAIYFYLRGRGLTNQALHGAGAQGALAPIAPGLGHVFSFKLDPLLSAVGNWGTGLRLMVWPHPLRVVYSLLDVPWFTIALTTQLVLLAVALARFRKGDSTLLAGLGWYYLALLPASQIVGRSHQGALLTERFLYFPSIGLALILAFGLAVIGRRLGPRWSLSPVLAIMLLLIPLTWGRNHDWHSNIRLFEKEYRMGTLGSREVGLLALSHAKEGNYARSAEICDRNPELVVMQVKIASACSTVYRLLGRTADAERAHLAYIAAVGYPSNLPLLAAYYYQKGRIADSVRVIDRAIARAPNPAVVAMLGAIRRVLLHPADREQLLAAKSELQEALRLNPRLRSAEFWTARVDALLLELDAGQPRAQ